MKSLILDQIIRIHPTCRVVFATSALGMGVDAPSIEQIIHVGPPRTLEAYFQETGRAGRDGRCAKAVLYFNNSDIQSSRKDMDNAIRMYCKSKDTCLRKHLLKHFGYDTPENCEAEECCDVCLAKCASVPMDVSKEFEDDSVQDQKVRKFLPGGKENLRKELCKF